MFNRTQTEKLEKSHGKTTSLWFKYISNLYNITSEQADLRSWQTLPHQRISPYSAMRVWDGEGTGHIQFDAHELAEPHLGHIIENRILQTAPKFFQKFGEA